LYPEDVNNDPPYKENAISSGAAKYYLIVIFPRKAEDKFFNSHFCL